MYLGGLITLAVLWPNLLVVLLPPREVPGSRPARSARLKAMEGVERVGQVGSFALPFFYPLRVEGLWDRVALGVMGLALALYYAGWLRYLVRGRAYRLLFAPYMGIPLPMALSPVVYFCAAALLLASWPLAVAAVVLGMGHLYVSHAECRRLEEGP